MSRTYKFIAYLNLHYSKKTILSILENGAKIGCVYKDQRFVDPQTNIIDTHAAMELIWSRFIENYEYGPLIYARYYQTHFSIWFYNENNKIYLYISPNHIGWKKRYDLCAWYGINFYRYQNFMLCLIGNNLIKHFENFEYFNETFDIEDIEGNNKIYVKLYTYWPYDVYHHLKVNGKILGISWLDAQKEPINLKDQDNAFEDIFFNEETPHQYWYAMHQDIMLKFTHIDKRTFIIEPMNIESSTTINQAKLLDTGLRTTIELFRNMPVFRLITFKSDDDILNINKMDD